MVPIRAALTLFVLSGWAQAAPLSPEKMAPYEKGFSAVQQSTGTFQAEVTQGLHLQGIARPIVSHGILYFAKPDRLLIRFSQPAGEWILVNSTEVAIKKTGQPLQRHDLSAGKSHASNLLDFFNRDPARWHDDFDVAMTREGDHLVVQLKPWMTPNSHAQGVEQIVTTLQLPNYDLLGMQVTISGENQIEYQFADGRRNIAIDPSLFKMP